MTSAPPTESNHAAAPPDPRTLATRREWIGLAVIALPCLVYAMDLTVLNLALPAISEHLHPSSSQLLWIIDVYGFLVAGFLITMGTMGDRIGRRKLLLIGAAFFAVASTLAAFADSAGMLIAMRALLGIAGATLAPSTLSLIRNMFHDERQRQFAIGVWIASFSVGSAIGPLVGGVLLEFFWWGSVFLLALPVMALLLIVGPSLLPEYKDPHAGRIDLVSVALSLFAVLSIIYALKQLAEHGLHTLPLALLAVGVAVGTAFIRRQTTLAYPLLDLALFQSRPFSAAITAYALSCLAMFGVYIYISQYLQLVLGLSPLMAGVALLPWALGFVFGSLLSPRLSRHVAPQTIMIWGLLSSSIGFALVWMAGTSWGLPALIAGTIVMSLGMAPVFTVGNEIIVTAAPPERAGSASAISETSAEFSGALGIAIFGSLGTLIYRMAVSDGLPASLSAEQRATSLATLGGAVATAQASPGPVADALLFVARDAFVSALQFTALVGGVLVLLAGVLTARILRDMPPKP